MCSDFLLVLSYLGAIPKCIKEGACILTSAFDLDQPKFNGATLQQWNIRFHTPYKLIG
ncbi:unnamed protein product [Musa acuminata subsp. malaccensis]|uniref:(wild Malaysian banana) hypothetical protein n=1 Tax=Musa acuminata subsp. malaccensis TaxID=214687 RepID=A0A804JIE7_MUSAM|nr:unnamed protein product [Musa acuminata subsp. malaccensis]